MTFQQLTCFVATARHGSFNAAGRALRLSQPAVSEQVRRLESELGAALVRRDGRGLALTSDGRALLAHAEALLAARDEATATVGRGARRTDTVLTLGVTRNAPHYPLDDLVAQVAAALPQVTLRLPGDNSAVIADAVRSGEFDAALLILPVDPSGLRIEPLFADEVVVVTADPDRAACPMTVERLADAPLILYDARHGFADPTRRQLAARAQAAGTALTPRFDVEHVETAVRMVARGLGDTVAARSATRQAWFPPSLHLAPFADPLQDHFALATRVGPEPTGAMGQLLTLVRDWAERSRPAT